MMDLNDELTLDYLADCREHLAEMETDLFSIQLAGPVFDSAQVDRIFRDVHSIWGGAAFFDLHVVRKLTSSMEVVLSGIRCGELEATPERIGTLVSATARLEALFRSPAESNDADIRDTLAALARGTEPESSRAPAALAKRKGSLRILLAEDDFACRLLLQTFLSRYGECHVTVNGVEAVEAFRLALLQNAPYDLVCMDIMMPEMDGREAVRRIRGMEEEQGTYSTAGAKIVMATTVGEVKEVILCFKELCDAYLMKPIDLGELLRQMKLLRLVEP